MKEEPGYCFTRLLCGMFLRPWIAMVGWGAFVHMSAHHIPISLPYLSYWEMFMLNCVFILLTSSQIQRWVKD